QALLPLCLNPLLLQVTESPFTPGEGTDLAAGRRAALAWEVFSPTQHHSPEKTKGGGINTSPLPAPGQIKYTGFRDRPHEERQARFQNACRDGRSEIAFVATGTNLSLQFFPASWQGEQRQTPTREYVDFEREAGKVYLKAPMILNGVCVIWKGWIDLQRLDGMGCLEFDEERAQQEDALAQQAFEEARRRTREFEDRDRSHREEMEARRQQDPSPGSNLGSGDDLKLR
uniref:Core-binding factor subunit beta n=1 Tax=Gopherus evgoodei TaxID=1825980 RepID=A0A8C4WH97_9SAUR